MKVLLVLLLVLVIGTSVSLVYGLKKYTDNTIPVPPQQQSQIFSNPTPTPTPTPPSIPNRHVIPQQLHVFQTFNNCGPASLSMQLSYFGKNVSQNTLGNSLRPYQHPTGDNDDKSVTLAELAQEAQKYDLNALHRPNGSIEKLTQLIALDLPVVIRTWLKEGEDIGHYRVIRGYDLDNQTLIQDDSLQGKDLIYSFDEMNNLWQAFNYEYLVLYPDEKTEDVAKVLQAEMDEQAAWEYARQRISQELVQEPNDIYAQFNMSVTLYHLGEYEGSVKAFEEVDDKLPARMLWYQIEPLWAYYEIGEYDKLTTIIDSILNNHNRAFSELYYLKGLMMIDQGMTESAQSEFEKALIYKRNFNPAQKALEKIN